MGGWLGVSISFQVSFPYESSLHTCTDIILLITGRSCVFLMRLFKFFFDLSLYFLLDDYLAKDGAWLYDTRVWGC